VACYSVNFTVFYPTHPSSRYLRAVRAVELIKVKVSHNRPRWPKGFRVG